MLVCKRCGANCDNSDIVSGICLDCIEEEDQKRIRNEGLERMIKTNSGQLELKLEDSLCLES